jgi:hypothetical protein
MKKHAFHFLLCAGLLTVSTVSQAQQRIDRKDPDARAKHASLRYRESYGLNDAQTEKVRQIMLSDEQSRVRLAEKYKGKKAESLTELKAIEARTEKSLQEVIGKRKASPRTIPNK